VKQHVLHVALKFADHEVEVVFVCTLAFLSPYLPFYAGADVPEVGGHMMWAGIHY